jgi:uncharacterized protein (TIGR02453 family)
MTSPFTGFPAEGLNFLAGLEANNNREWFNEHKEEYIEFVQEPMAVFVGALGPRLQEISPGIEYDTRTNGSGSMMRIYRDTRFSKDKTPYKTQVAAGFWEGTRKKMQNPIFGFQWGADGGGMMAGTHGFDKEMLESYRQAVDDEKQGTELEAILTQILAAGDYEIGGTHYKTTPRGYDKNHPRSALLRHAGLWVYPPGLSPAELQTPDLIDKCVAEWRVMVLVHRWLVGLS